MTRALFFLLDSGEAALINYPEELSREQHIAKTDALLDRPHAWKGI